MAHILILDIETAPNLAYVWRFYKENVGANQVVKNSEIISWAAKWYGEGKGLVHYDTFIYSEKFILEKLMALLDRADIVVAHYGSKFDIPRIKARALVHGIKPPSPFKIVDTKVVASKEFNFEANSLEHLANVLNCTKKGDHRKFPGFLLWSECLKGNYDAWNELKAYNLQDVEVLEEVYTKMLPWITNHPNVAIYEEGEEIACPKCGSKEHQRRGFYYTQASKYQRYQCKKCGGWHRSRYNELNKDKRKVIAVNAI